MCSPYILKTYSVYIVVCIVCMCFGFVIPVASRKVGLLYLPTSTISPYCATNELPKEPISTCTYYSIVVVVVGHSWIRATSPPIQSEIHIRPGEPSTPCMEYSTIMFCIHIMGGHACIQLETYRCKMPSHGISDYVVYSVLSTPNSFTSPSFPLHQRHRHVSNLP